ncbi:MAG: Aspartokinase [Labilithrix sp.]|nr:Aspartokinase [Labilithrix sp.]
MSVIVQKYGGSSVADVEKIGHVADRVVAAKREGHDVVVVVSAMGKTTDGLIDLARRAAETAAAGSEPPRRELDMLVSTGERVTMALLSIAIHARGHDAISFTGSQSGILTNDRHFDARIIEVRPHRIQDELSRGRIVIVAGYQGMSYKREITTLGRGGSDTTAVALAAALAAERCEIYSDVDGVYSADPRVVGDPKHLPEMDLSMLGEMAEAGAKVLNAQAVEWARRNKIVIHARKTADAVGSGRETVAARDDDEIARSHDENKNVRAIVGIGGVMVARVSASSLPLFLATAAQEELSVGDVIASGDDAFVHLPLLNTPDWQRCARAIERAVGNATTILGKRAVVSVVGYGLTGTSGALGRVYECLARIGAMPLCVSAGPLRISVTIDEAKLADAQKALHAAFVE